MIIKNLLIGIEVAALTIVMFFSSARSIAASATSIETFSANTIFVEYATATW